MAPSTSSHFHVSNPARPLIPFSAKKRDAPLANDRKEELTFESTLVHSYLHHRKKHNGTSRE